MKREIQDGATRLIYDDADDKLHIVRKRDVSPILEANKRAYADASRGNFKSEVFNKKASIPLEVLLEWCQARGVTYQDWMIDDKLQKAFINDPDNQFCLVKPGKI